MSFIETNRNASLRHRLWALRINFWAWLRQPGADSFGWYFPQTPVDWLSLIFRGLYWLAVARAVFWMVFQPESIMELNYLLPRVLDDIRTLAITVGYAGGRGAREIQDMIVDMPLYEGIPAAALLAAFVVYFFIRMNRR